jgi:hypothetical protein
MNKLFVIGSGELISDYDFIPEGMSDEEKDKCESCWYRWRMIALDTAKANRKNPRGRINYGEPTPNCSRETCLIDNQDPRKVIKAKKLAFVGGRR